jgi:ecotin
MKFRFIARLILATFFLLSSLANATEGLPGISFEFNRELATGESIRNLEPFPLPVVGEKRTVIHMPNIWSREKEDRLELLIGKMKLLDRCNSFYVDGKITVEQLKGWGYSFYRAEVGDSVIGSRMACPNQPGLVMRFVGSVSQSDIAYNTQLPVVIYSAPEVVIRFRVWSAPRGYVEVPAR